MRHRVVIVGAGFSGVALAAHLTRRRDAPAVSIIERDGRFGPGLAYSTVDPSHLLNVRASRMSAFADQPEHFIDWLRARGRLAEADPFAPRAVYGAYIEHVFHRARRSKLFGAVRRVRDEAVSCAPVGGAWRIGFASGRQMDADSVVLAIGHPPPQPPDAVTRGGVPVIGAWDRRAQKRISPHANVLIVGTGLSMVDVALSLRGGGGTGVLYAVSRRGLTPRAHVAAHAAPDALHLPDQLSAALHEFRAEIRRMAERGEPWQSAFDRIRRDTPALWRRLSPDAQRRFLRHLRPWWDVHRHRASPEVSARVDAMRATGVLRVIAGEIESVAQAPHGAVVTYRPRGARSRETLTVGHVIDCTGADNRLAQMRSPLVRQLTADGLARAHPTGLGFDVGEDGGLLGADGQPLKGLFALGPIVQGAFWETTAVPEIRARAAALADLLCLR